MSDSILSVSNISKVFPKRGSRDISVLENIDLSLCENEIVCLLGTSGSGKSTLLRIMSGLIAPSQGDVYWYGSPVKGPVPGVSMVFQNFALLPWLTVLENVELGLEAKKMSSSERRERALSAIDVVGMDGFESAYPKELSGGMCQRVGFARAIVVEPDILFMDEPFSALDVLTAENLRSDLLDLWVSKKTKLKAILMVTHNIQEAALMADRILVFGTNPGRIMADLRVDMPYDREQDDPKFTALVDSIYHHITQSGSSSRVGGRLRSIDMHYRLPSVDIESLIGLVEALHSGEPSQRVELSELSEELHLDLDEILPIIECLQLVRFAQLRSGKVELTFAGKLFANASLLDQKQIFSRQLLDYLPIIKHIHERLTANRDQAIHQSEFIDLLAEKLSDAAAKEVLTTIIEWCRYAELFAFNVNSGHLSLDNPGEEDDLKE